MYDFKQTTTEMWNTLLFTWEKQERSFPQTEYNVFIIYRSRKALRVRFFFYYESWASSIQWFLMHIKKTGRQRNRGCSNMKCM